MYKNVQLFIRSKADILNIVVFKYSLHTDIEIILHSNNSCFEHDLQ